MSSFTADAMTSTAGSRRVVVISGATGFLGLALAAHFQRAGYEVRALARSPGRAATRHPSFTWYRCSLPEALDPRALEGAPTALIHCAFETHFRSEASARATNVEGSRLLLEAARRAGVGRFVFISSMSAHERAESIYGRTKLEVERMLDGGRDLSVRPGLIIGSGGVFLRLATAIAGSRVVPLFYGGRQPIQTIALQDVCAGILAAVERGCVGTLRLGEEESVPLRELYRAIAAWAGVRPLFIPFPGGVGLSWLRVAERLGVRLPLSSENLLGLKHLEECEVRQDLARVGLRPRTMRQSLSDLARPRTPRRPGLTSRLKPTPAEIRELALRETDPAEWPHFQPITRGPLFAVLLLAGVGIAAAPSALVRMLRGAGGQHGA